MQRREGAAIVEFAICAPVLLLIGFGFINAGLLVQMRHNSKIIGHMAATEVFKETSRDATTISGIETKYETMAADLGIVGMDVAVTAGTGEIAVVTTSMSVSDNSLIPLNFQTSDSVVTETHVFAPFN